MDPKIYAGIDLKSFYASSECVERRLDPLTTNLVVADPTRTEKTICLAVTPSLKAYGISGRARLFEVVQRVREVNAERMKAAIRGGHLKQDSDGKYHFAGSSYDAEALAADPSLELTYIVAPPRMKMYERYSTKIYGIYLKYLAPEDIIVYSIDEIFADLTGYLATYHMTAHELVMTMIREVLYETGITATAGLGTNLYLAKVAMDIVAKHVPADKDGVRIAELNERTYREKLWCHRPITDFWRIGPGIARRLEKLNCFTMGDVARLSERDEAALYKALGINAELVIDHAWGWEPTEIRTIKQYKPTAKSLTSGQVLMEPYDWDKARNIVMEMAELLVLDLVRKGVVTKKVTLTIGYDRESLVVAKQGSTSKDSIFNVKKTGKQYIGAVTADYYGRVVPKHAHGTQNLDQYTSSTKKITDAMLSIYDRTVNPDLLIRRVNIVAEGIISESEIPDEPPEQMDLFTNYAEKEKQEASASVALEKEKRIQQATLLIQSKYGKNALLKGMNFKEGATTRDRNQQVGGHRVGEDNG